MVDMNGIQIQALYGGTFDPVHYGHLKSVEALTTIIDLPRITIILNSMSSYRSQPETSREQRKTMLGLAIANKPLFELGTYEIQCNNSHVSQVIQKWRNKQGLYQPLAFIIGQDSLLTFHNWYRYNTILNNSHLIVCRRPSYSSRMKKKQHQQWLEKHLTNNVDDLYSLPSGKIYLAKTPWFNISATIIRQRLQKGLSCKGMLPSSVLSYILQQGLYQKRQ